MKGSHKHDPVQVLNLEGALIAVVRCPHMHDGDKASRRPFLRRPRECGQQATLVRFPPPFGLRTYCEEGHVEVVSHLSHPMVLPPKGATD